MESLVNDTIPVFVEVTASESHSFQKEHQYPFAEFEALALSVALTNPVGGYDKTYVRVHFSNKDIYECRLDLGCGGNDQGFAEHCLSIIEYDEREQQKAFEVHHQKEQEFQDNLVVPDWAKAVIIAPLTEYDSDNSESYAGYHQTKTVRTIILAWSKHTRNLFPELRKACLRHSDTQFLHDKNQSLEHRQTHWSGDGYFLSDLDYIRHGWQVRKAFLGSKEKSHHVLFGEWAITE